MSTSTIESRAVLITTAEITDEALSVGLNDGRRISVPLAWYPRLDRGTADERANWRLIGKGCGLHWPQLDEDISLESILAGRASGESQSSLKRWLASRPTANHDTIV